MQHEKMETVPMTTVRYNTKFNSLKLKIYIPISNTYDVFILQIVGSLKADLNRKAKNTIFKLRFMRLPSYNFNFLGLYYYK